MFINNKITVIVIIVYSTMQMLAGIAVDTGVNEIIPSTHKLGVRTNNPNEILTVNGNLALKENPRPGSTSNFGKLYVNGSTSNLMFLDDAGIQYDITSSSAVPGGANTQFQFNDSGVFAGNGSLAFTKASRTIAVAANAPLDINSTNLTIADTNIVFDGGSTTFSPTGALTLLPQNGSNLNVTLLGLSDMLIDSTKITLNNNGNVGIGVLPNINNFVSVNGDLALKEIAAATAPSGYGKIYIDSSNSELCFDADDQSPVCLTNNGQVAGSGGGGGSSTLKPYFHGFSHDYSPMWNTMPESQFTINVPAGTAENDLMIASFLITDPSSADITSAGWTLVNKTMGPVDPVVSSTINGVVLYKIAGPSEPSDYTFNFSTSAYGVGVISTYKNVDPISPISASSASNGFTATTSAISPNINAFSANNHTIVRVLSYLFFATYGSTSNGYVDRVNFAGGDGFYMALVDKNGMNASISSETHTMGGANSAYTTHTLALKGKAGGGGGGGGGGGASPAGSNGSVQFRQNSTTMGADANNLHWDDTNNRLGIITNSPLTTLHLNGSLALYPRNDTVIQASNGIVASKLTNSVLYIRGECGGGVVDIVPNSQIAPGYPGQLLTLVGMYEAEGVKFDTTISFKLDGNTSFTLGENDTLTLIYAPGGWIEVSRSDNPGLGIPCP